MGRHYKGLCRNPIMIRTADVKRPVWLLEMPKSPTRILSAIQTTVIVASFIGFLWCLWKLPEEHNAYPDGFIQCPASSYNILDDRNVTIKCKTCPECPHGQGLTPPCGSTISTETPVTCTMCDSSETFSEEYGSGTCKPCLSCGLRETISPCTPEKNTQCGDCPARHYQADFTMDSCKKCSSCCGGRSYAELECIYLKQCRRTNCTQQLKNEQNRVQILQKIIPTFTTPGRLTNRRMEHQIVLQSGNLKDAGNAVSENIISQIKNLRFEREVSTTLQKTDVVNAPKIVEETSIRFHARDSNPSIKTTAFDANEAVMHLSTTESKLKQGLGTAPEHTVMEPTLPLTSSYFDGIKKCLSILIALAVFAILMLIFIAVIVACICCRRTQPARQFQGNGWTITGCVSCVKYVHVGESDEYLPTLRHSTPQSDDDFQEILHNSDSMVGNNRAHLESLFLSDIPLDLEDLLVKRLDVRRTGECFCGWEKVGIEFGITRDDLEYLKLALERVGGSPTNDLLTILGSQGRNAADLVKVLNSPKVNCPDIAVLIQQYMNN